MISEDAKGFWRLVPGVRATERRRFAFFFAISALISLAQTLGLVGSEALFLARFGVEFLPHVFIAASLTTVVGMLIYAALVGSVRNDKMFVYLLCLAAFLLGAAAFVDASGVELLVPGLLVVYFLTQAIFLSHFWTFASDYFDIMASKRLAHLFTFGASAGGVVGGGVALAVSQVAPLEMLIAGWAVVLLATAGFIRFRRRDLFRWGLVDLVELDETSLEGLVSGLRYLKRSALGRWLAVSAVSMTLALFVSQYLYSAVFVDAFPTAESLAFFFGIYLAATNLVEILIEFAVTPWLVRRLGVARANLVHPVFTAVSFLGLAIEPSLSVAVMARMNRDMLENSMSVTIRNLTYNAIAQRFRSRMRAFVEGIVVQATMAGAGLLLLLNLELDPIWLCAAGGGLALLSFFVNLKIRDEYLNTLVAGLREGRLDLAQLDDQFGSWEASRIAELWNNLIGCGGSDASRSARQLAPMLAARELAEPLVRGASHEDPQVRSVCIAALASSSAGIPESVLLSAVADNDVSVRRRAVEVLVGRFDVKLSPNCAPQLDALLGDEDHEVRAQAASVSGPAGLLVLEGMARSDEVETAVIALRSLPAELAELACERVGDPNPQVHAAALEAIARLARSVSIGRDRLASDLDHAHPRVRGAAVMALAATAGANMESLETVASALTDSNRHVRRRAVEALRALGEEGARAAIPYVKWDSEGAAEAAIEVLSPPDGPQLRKLFVSELRRRVRQAWGDFLALHVLPQHGVLSIRFLRAAHADSARRNQKIAFALLRGIEDPAVVWSVERALRLGSPRVRAEALEVLSNLGDRQSGSQLVLMLEKLPSEDRVRLGKTFAAPASDLDEAVNADRRALDVWIRMGAHYYRKEGGEDLSQRETMERLLLLRDVPLFSELSLEQLQAISQIMSENQYLSREVVFREGDPAGELYLLIEGSAQILTGYGTPERVVLDSLDAPAYFGEMAILDNQPRSASVVVTEDARILSLSGDSFKDLMLGMPEISFEICRLLSTRVRALNAQLQSPAPASLT